MKLVHAIFSFRNKTWSVFGHRWRATPQRCLNVNISNGLKFWRRVRGSAKNSTDAQSGLICKVVKVQRRLSAVTSSALSLQALTQSGNHAISQSIAHLIHESLHRSMIKSFSYSLTEIILIWKAAPLQNGACFIQNTFALD